MNKCPFCNDNVTKESLDPLDFHFLIHCSNCGTLIIPDGKIRNSDKLLERIRKCRVDYPAEKRGFVVNDFKYFATKYNNENYAFLDMYDFMVGGKKEYSVSNI